MDTVLEYQSAFADTKTTVTSLRMHHSDTTSKEGKLLF